MITLGFSISPNQTTFCGLWLCLPSTARVYRYHYLVRLGRWLYGPTGAVSVTRVPFGLYIKQTTHSGLDEPNLMPSNLLNAIYPSPHHVLSMSQETEMRIIS